MNAQMSTSIIVAVEIQSSPVCIENMIGEIHSVSKELKYQSNSIMHFGRQNCEAR